LKSDLPRKAAVAARGYILHCAAGQLAFKIKVQMARKHDFYLFYILQKSRKILSTVFVIVLYYCIS